MAHPPITRQSAVATLTAGRCTQLFAVLADDPARLSDAELGEVVAGLLQARAGAEAALFALTREAESRGTISASTSANPAQWVKARATEVEVPVTDAAAVQQAVMGTRAPGMALLVEATASARVPVASCAAVTRVWGRIHALIEPADQDEALHRLTTRAATGASMRTLSHLGEELLATFAIEGIYEKLTDHRAQARAMSPFRYQTNSGLYTATVRLDAASTSLVESVIGALAAPAPGADGGVDWRNSDQRRADALIEACALVSTHTHELGGLNVPRAMADAVAAAGDTDALAGAAEADADGTGRAEPQCRPASAGDTRATEGHTGTAGSDDEDRRQQERIAQFRATERETARIATAPARGTAAQMRVTIP
ncbi:MAG: hypothetical protein Q4G40_13005, partial [Brachybacterium sp.]|nr:hypothetical protein [Brachybacterium sp.]